MNIGYLRMIAFCLLLAACGSPAATTPASEATALPGTVAAVPSQPQAPKTAGAIQGAALRPALQTLATTSTTAIVAAATAGNKAQAKQATDAFEATWVTVEDGVKSLSPDGYKAIEQAMNDLQDVAVRADTIDPAAVQARGAALTKALNDVSATLK